jgi:two-component system, NtrC family, nitrogen regulation response regulator NtrX
MVPGDTIGPEDLPPPLRAKEVPAPVTDGKPLKEARDSFERAYILAELRAQDWNMTRTAERLGIERSHLYRKIRAYGINPPK